MQRMITLEEWEDEQQSDPEFVAALKELAPAYQVARLRLLHGLIQMKSLDTRIEMRLVPLDDPQAQPKSQ